MVRVRMHVLKYVPKQLFGFVVGPEEIQVFFHIRAFKWGSFPTFPPPLIGEEVEVEYDPDDSSEGTSRAPKARTVTRLQEPVASLGVVEEFSEKRGYGFIATDDGRTHYLHRSEMVDGSLPMTGMAVEFFEGFRQGRPRACFVKLTGYNT